MISTITPCTAEKLLTAPHFKNLKNAMFSQLPEAFDFDTFWKRSNVRHFYCFKIATTRSSALLIQFLKNRFESQI